MPLQYTLAESIDLPKEEKFDHIHNNDAASMLSAILTLNIADRNMLSCILKQSDCDMSHLNYDKLFSQGLLDALANAEKEALQRNCDGEYRPGELCGLDADPLICAQDSPDFYLYRIIKTTESEAIIESAWPQYPGSEGAVPEDHTTYRMLKKNGHWILDGINKEAFCAYNW